MVGFRYGSDWERFPCEVGELWAAGPHLLAAGDLRDHGQTLMDLAQADVVYTDPPWTQAIADAFRAGAGLSDVVELGALLCSIAELAAAPTVKLAWVEMGRRGLPVLARAMRSEGLQSLAVYETRYGAGNATAAVLGLFGRDGQAFEDEGALIGADAVEWALTRYAGQTVFDPCIGSGMTLRVGHALGYDVAGTELSPRKLATALAWASRQGLEVRRLGPLS